MSVKGYAVISIIKALERSSRILSTDNELQEGLHFLSFACLTISTTALTQDDLMKFMVSYLSLEKIKLNGKRKLRISSCLNPQIRTKISEDSKITGLVPKCVEISLQ